MEFTIRCRSICKRPTAVLGYERGAFPIAERCAKEFVSLPMFPELTSAQVEIVVQCVKEVVVAETVA